LAVWSTRADSTGSWPIKDASSPMLLRDELAEAMTCATTPESVLAFRASLARERQSSRVIGLTGGAGGFGACAGGGVPAAAGARRGAAAGGRDSVRGFAGVAAGPAGPCVMEGIGVGAATCLRTRSSSTRSENCDLSR
jgi:hypothetical protein